MKRLETRIGGLIVPVNIIFLVIGLILFCLSIQVWAEDDGIYTYVGDVILSEDNVGYKRIISKEVLTNFDYIKELEIKIKELERRIYELEKKSNIATEEALEGDWVFDTVWTHDSWTLKDIYTNVIFFLRNDCINSDCTRIRLSR